MASPQLEDGYTRIANELLERIAAFDFTKRQYKLLLAIIRLTYGYNRKMAHISNHQLATLTGLEARNMRRAVLELVSMGCVSKQPAGQGYLIGIRKDYSRWKCGSKQPARVGTTQRGTDQAVSKRPANSKDSTTTTVTTKKEKPRARKALDPLSGFDEFWALYGKRVSKSDARKAWDRKVTTPELRETIMAALTQQIEWRLKAKECGVWFSYWPNGSTWINGEHWANEKPPELDQALSKLHQLSPELQAAANRHEDWRDPLDTGGVFDHDDVPF